jgi:TonB family protein
MKTIYTLFIAAFILLTVHSASAQTKTVKYLSKSGYKEVPASEAYYFDIEEVGADGIITITRYLMEDSIKAQLSTVRKRKNEFGIHNERHGVQYEWHKNGKLAAEYTYENGELVGEYRKWYETGEIDYIRKYSSGSSLNSLEAYHKNGQLRRAEIYEGTKFYKGKVFDEAGSEIDYFPMLQMPSFPGGEQAMLTWLSKNIGYPKAARKARAQGLVVITFEVNEAGQITDAEVIKGIHPDADAEALRLINSMPLWENGLLEGKPTKVRFTLPVRFSMN